MCKNSDNWSAIGYPSDDGMYRVTSVYDVYCHNCHKFVNLITGDEIAPNGRGILRHYDTPRKPKPMEPEEAVMDIKELKKLKKELQVSISYEVSQLVEKFKSKTKVSPTSIDIDMFAIQSLGAEAEYIVGDTSVYIEI